MREKRDNKKKQKMIGQLAIKIAGREAGKHCVIVDKIDSNHVLIDGNLRRKKCNILHLELLNKKLDLKKGASTEDVHMAMEKEGIKTVKLNPKKESKPKPLKQRKSSNNKKIGEDKASKKKNVKRAKKQVN